MIASDYKISVRIGAGFFVLVAITLLLGLLSLVQLSEVAGTTENLATNSLPSVELAGEIRDQINNIRRAESRHLLSSTRKEMKAMEAQIAGVRKKLEDLDAIAVQRFTSPDARKVLDTYKQQRQAWYTADELLTTTSRAGKQDEATNIYNGESETSYNAVMTEIAKLSSLSSEEAAAAWDSAKTTYNNARLIVLVSILVALAAASALAFVIARSIAGPIEKAVQAASEMASGDMTVALQVVGKDETAQLLRSLEAMRSKLALVVNAVRQSADLFATTSTEIARGNQDLSHRSEQQASALEQTASSMEQLGVTVKQNADHAHQGSELATQASAVAVKGQDVVKQVFTSMNAINASSKKIADIITIIDGIAFQTNILALNAAVEAARAGEHGRGFAVVATEVRTLAGRCSQAAKEINALISASVAQVRSGSTLVEEAGTTMNDVVKSIRGVSDLMGEITIASREQLSGVSQVGSAITNIDQVTQQNVALVDRLATAAGSLESQAGELVQTVAVFKLNQHLELGHA